MFLNVDFRLIYVLANEIQTHMTGLKILISHSIPGQHALYSLEAFSLPIDKSSKADYIHHVSHGCSFLPFIV
jgi:hypothetical protein